MIQKKKNVIKLLTLDPKAVTSEENNGMDEEDDSNKSLDSSSHKLILNLPASNTLIGKREQAKKLKSSLASQDFHDDNSSIGSSSLHQFHEHNDNDDDKGVFLEESSASSPSSGYNIQKDRYVQQKYFTNTTKSNFFAKNSLNERYKYLHHVNQDLLPTEDLNLMKSTIFDTPLQKINEFPFAVRRPDIEDHQDEFEDYDLHPEEDAAGQGEHGNLPHLHLIPQQDPTDHSIFSTSYCLSTPSPASPLPRSSSPPPRHQQHHRHRQSPLHTHHNNSSTSTSFLHPNSFSSSYSSEINSKLTHYTTHTPTSPRSKYLVGCLRESLNPRASLILRKHVNDELNLQHLGMGDKMGLVFAESLSELPQVNSINLCDNNLTDKSLSLIIQTICQMKQLTSLNLSINKIDSESCKALAEFLLQPFCSLKSLVLHKADIDDFECHMFVAALDTNTVLKSLDLSSNLIGRSENLNSVKPNVVTGGEALAALLRCNSCHLESLNLSWNLIRMDGACSLAESLAMNHHLLFLDLSYNSLGQQAGELIGKSLLSNHSLKTLLLSNNAIPSSACCTICVGIERNQSLEHVNLDGNPIGEEGAKMLMQLPYSCGKRVKLSAQKCNLSISQSNPDHISFDIANIPGNYRLRMDQAYERAICLKLLTLVAENLTLKFEQFEYEPPPTPQVPSPPLVPIPLRQHILKIPYEEQAIQDRVLVEQLQVVIKAAEDFNLAKELFSKFDADQSGALDLDELQDLIKHFSPAIEPAALEEAINGYDIDGRCVMELDEFLDFLSVQRAEAMARVREITERPILCHATGLPATATATADDSSVKKIYVPPHTGIIHLRVSDGYLRKEMCKVVSASDQENVMTLAGADDDNKVKLLSFSLANTKIRMREAWGVYQMILVETRDRVAALEVLLPFMYDPKEAKALMSKALNNDRVELARLREKMGLSLKPIVGMPDGYYSLDLSLKKDRACFSSLIEQSEYMKLLRIRQSYEGKGEIGDVSQRGDWSSFRNSFYNKHRIFITPELFSSIPLQGHLTFDFSGSDFPPIHSHGGGGCVTISDIRLTNVLFNVAVINKIQKIHALHSLAMLEHETKRCILGDGSNTPPAIDTKIKSKGIRIAMNKFYLKLSLREKQMKKSLKNEEMKIGLKKGSMTSFAETDHEEKGEGDSDDDDDDEEGDGEVEESEEEESEDDDEKSRRSSKSSNKSDGDCSISGDDDDRDDAEKKKMRKKSQKQSQSMQQQIRKVSVVQEAVALTLTGVQPSRSSSNLNNYETNKSPSTRKVQGNNGNGSRRSTSKPKGTSSSSRIGFSTESKSEYTSNSTTTTGRLTRLPSTSAAAGTVATPTTTTAAAVSRKPFNPKQLLPQKSSFAVDEKTGKTVRKLGNILTLSGSEKYLLEIGRKFINMSQLEKVSNHAKCIRIIQALEDILGRVWILSKHLAIIVGCFQLGLTNKTQTFGTYRVELIISLYCRVIDLYNFDLVLGVLTATEIGCLICRLGYLNIFNPLKPEGWYHLDFTIHEERMIGKLLGTLSFQEPGINFLYPRFRWEWSFEDIPGWSLLPTWIDETVFPHRGILSVQYYSGEGTNIHGCSPDPLFRRSLFPMVRIRDENYAADEQAIARGVNGLVGWNSMRSHQSVWTGFLCPPNSTSAQIARGIPMSTVFPTDLLLSGLPFGHLQSQEIGGPPSTGRKQEIQTSRRSEKNSTTRN